MADPQPIIQSFIHGEISLSNIVSTLAEPIETAYTSGKEAESHLWDLWYTIIDIAKLTPYTSASTQSKLVDLVAALKARPNPPSPPTENDWQCGYDGLWSNLKIFGPSMRETWNEEPCGDPLPGMAVDEWTNLNAFVARITEAGVADFLLYALWGARGALESDLKDADLDRLVPGVAVWFLITGEKIYESEDEYGRPGKGDALWDGKWGFCKERWQLWKERLAAIAKSEGLLESTRDIARQAVNVMDGIEQGRVDNESTSVARS